jgi:RNA polymerase sigma-70 factor, ECF subfamily
VTPRIVSAAYSRSYVEFAKVCPLEEEVVNLFDQLQDRILRYLSSLGLSASGGDEVIQEAFLALFLHLQHEKPCQNLRAWVFQVSNNLALRQRNATLRNRQTLVEHDTVAAENVFIDGAPSPEDRLAGNERRARLLNIWRALPEQDRCCLGLRAEGLIYREISQVLDNSLGAVSLWLGRSLARFARADAQ